jgi:hypothetical protein
MVVMSEWTILFWLVHLDFNPFDSESVPATAHEPIVMPFNAAGNGA